MNPAEAARLLGHAAAFDRRTVGEIDARAWAAALPDVPLDQDALDAVARFYGDVAPDASAKYDPARRRWLEPHHVRFHRRQIRDARISAANATYDGNPDESWPEAIRNRRALMKAAGDGQLPPQTARAAIESGRGVDSTGKGQAILNAIGRNSISRRPEFTAPCPHCGVAAGVPCRNGRGERRRDAHPIRIEASRRLHAGEPPVSRDEIQHEQERRRTAAANTVASLTDEDRAQLTDFEHQLRNTETS